MNHAQSHEKHLFTNTIDILAVICTSFEIATVILIYPIAQWRGAE